LYSDDTWHDYLNFWLGFYNQKGMKEFTGNFWAGLLRPRFSIEYLAIQLRGSPYSM
jgi:hypothetical protein